MVLCHALNFASKSLLIDPDFHVFSYDISSRCYHDQSRSIGDATREQLPSDLLEHVVFRNPNVAADAADDHPTIRFAFIDANHEHPWPTLDLLALLDCLEVGAQVLLHDVNLPLIHAEHQVWGAKWLFDAVELEKMVTDDVEIPNIGPFSIAADKERVREQLIALLASETWAANVSEAQR